jgi:hypothetical protein
MKTCIPLLLVLLTGCTTIHYVEPQPQVVVVNGQRVLVPPPNVVREQMREKVKGFLNGCVNTAVAAERRLGRLPRRLEIEGFCAGQAVENFSWLAGADTWELREIRENFEISLDRVDWRK